MALTKMQSLLSPSTHGMHSFRAPQAVDIDWVLLENPRPRSRLPTQDHVVGLHQLALQSKAKCGLVTADAMRDMQFYMNVLEVQSQAQEQSTSTALQDWPTSASAKVHGDWEKERDKDQSNKQPVVAPDRVDTALISGHHLEQLRMRGIQPSRRTNEIHMHIAPTMDWSVKHVIACPPSMTTAVAPKKKSVVTMAKAFVIRRASTTFDNQAKVEVLVWWQLHWLARLACFVVHIVCGLFCALTAYGYAAVTHLQVNLTLTNQSIGMGGSHYPVFIVVFSVLAAAHVACLLLLVAPATSTCSTSTSTSRLHIKCSPIQICFSRVRSQVRNIFGERGLLGVKGTHFETIYAMRKLASVLSQANVTSHIAARLSREWLVRAYVALLVINCWTTPLAQRLVRKRSIGGQRLCCVLIDLFFDFAWAIGIHTQVAYGLVDSYDSQTTNLKKPIFSDPKALIVVENQLRLLLVGSHIDLASRVVLHVTVMTSLTSIMPLLQVETRRRIRNVASVAATPGPSNKETPTRPPRSLVSRRWHQLLKFLTPCVGLVAITLNLIAEIQSGHVQGACILPLRAWFKERSSCAMLVLNCTATGMTGVANELTLGLSTVDPTQLQVLTITDCSELEMPSALQDFHRLDALYVFKSSILKWDSHAAITRTHHPRSFTAGKVELPNGQIPDGLLHTDFPPQLKAISFFGSNLTTLPDTVDRIWPSGLYLFVEWSRLRVVPDVLPRMGIPFLSLTGNQLTTIPMEMMYMPALAHVLLRNNPITVLPSVPAEVLAKRGRPWPQTRVLDLTHTSLRSLPEWVTQCHFTIRGAETPMCARCQQEASGLTAVEAAIKPLVDCVTQVPPIFTVA